MKSRSNSEAGFSLVEVLVAFTILSVSIIAALQIVSAGLRGTTMVDQRTVTFHAARLQFDRMSLKKSLTEGTVAASIETVRMKIVVRRLQDVSGPVGSELSPFLVSIVDAPPLTTGSQEPVLEGILLARTQQ